MEVNYTNEIGPRFVTDFIVDFEWYRRAAGDFTFARFTSDNKISILPRLEEVSFGRIDILKII